MVVSLVTGANRWVLVTATLALLTTARCFSVSVVCDANRGIGLELCRQLKARGESVVAVCRKTSPQLDGLGVHRVIEGVDVSEDSQVATLTDKLSGESVHQLWCNAGVLSVESLEDMDFDRIRRQFEVNTLGPLRVVKALLPNLQSGSKVLIMTSRMGSIDDNTSGGYYGYRMSKTAVNSAAKSLALDLKPRGVSVALLHPEAPHPQQQWMVGLSKLFLWQWSRQTTLVSQDGMSGAALTTRFLTSTSMTRGLHKSSRVNLKVACSLHQ